LDQERVAYEEALSKAKATIKPNQKEKEETAKAEQALKKIREEYVPIDFSAYTIEDSKSPLAG
jgi:hypothetical protein